MDGHGVTHSFHMKSTDYSGSEVGLRMPYPSKYLQVPACNLLQILTEALDGDAQCHFVRMDINTVYVYITYISYIVATKKIMKDCQTPAVSLPVPLLSRACPPNGMGQLPLCQGLEGVRKMPFYCGDGVPLEFFR